MTLSRWRVSIRFMKKNPKYHTGNLRKQLIDESIALLSDAGLDAFSMRKLAERAGVSRTAPYHHFKDKNDLLAAIAEQGFEKMSTQLKAIDDETAQQTSVKFEKAISTYIDFALDNVVQYELMFGRELWCNKPSAKLQRTAKDCFRTYAAVIEKIQRDGLLKQGDDVLRMAQVLWSTMHGLVKLAQDGIFVRKEDLREMAKYAISQYKA